VSWSRAVGQTAAHRVRDGATAVDTTIGVTAAAYINNDLDAANDTLITTQPPANAESTAMLETEVRPSWWFIVSGSTVGNR